MKNTTIGILVAGLILLASCGACSNNDVEKYIPPKPNPNDSVPNGGGDTVTNGKYRQRAKEQYDLVNQLFRKVPANQASLYKENMNDAAYSYLWAFDGAISGITALHKLGYDVNYEAMTDNFEKYYRPSAVFNIPGYGSSTNGTTGGGDRFYDDNSIIGIELVDAYKLTQKQKYLDRCAMIFAFIQTGLDDTMGEALWWSENQKGNSDKTECYKPTCANGFAANFLLNYYSICPSPSDKAAVLAFAKKLYTWTKATLQDPGDKTYWDEIHLSGINQYKWTYNSGIMISNGLLLYQITGEQQYLTHAKETAAGAYNYFVKARNGIALTYPASDPWFNTKLLKAYIEIEPYFPNVTNYIKVYISYIDHAYEHARMPNGLYYEDWTGAEPKRYTDLLHQVAVIESYGLIALYKGETAAD
jgi:hypothetical protein